MRMAETIVGTHDSFEFDDGEILWEWEAYTRVYSTSGPKRYWSVSGHADTVWWAIKAMCLEVECLLKEP
jgi:hypothetical protein